MSDVVNLNRFRKAKARLAKDAAAAANRARFGRTKDQKARDQAEQAQVHRLLDGVRRDTPPDDGGRS